MFLLAIAGVSLTATAVTWWNGRQTEAVREEIAQLEARLDQIYAADATARRALITVYLRSLEALIDQESNTRTAIASELTACLAKARGIKRSRFGSREMASFQRALLELELASSRADAERAWLQSLKATVRRAAEKPGAALPSPAALDLPNDFPRNGGLVRFEGDAPERLHGYRLRIEDEAEGAVGLYDVDHTRKLVRSSATRGTLLEANLTDGGGPLSAQVFRRDQDGIHLRYQDAHLLLPTKRGRGFAWLKLEDQVEVYPELWTLDEVTRLDEQRPLRVRLHPRVEGSRQVWSPILLAASEAMFPALVEAYKHISNPSLEGAPWRLHVLPSGALGFTLGEVTLRTRPDYALQALVLEGVSMTPSMPDFFIRLQADLSVFVPGSPDEATADRSLFHSFIEAVHGELTSQKQLLLQRRMALRLRKLSLIYQDQEEHLRATGSCGLLVGRAERGGRLLIGTVTDIPPWLDRALSGERETRLRAVGADRSWGVRRGRWRAREVGVCEVELALPAEADYHEIGPFQISRLELVGEGSQQQTLSRALESAILGRFTSPRVHDTLLGLPGDTVANQNLGHEAVDRVLASGAEVVAIWGPPGTGKTTTLVRWLLSLFPPGQEQHWPSVLLAAPTHVAVDKLLVDLLGKAGRLSDEAVRYANEERITGSGLEPLWHRRLLRALEGSRSSKSPSAQRWARLMDTREGRAAAAKWLLGPRHIHAATCVGMARRDYGLRERTFDIAIIDEAGKAFGAELLIPAALARRLVLVGDHNQLPPTVTADMLDEGIGYRLSLREVEALLRRNAFQEIFEQLPAENKAMLSTQYRMNRDIGELVSALFYEDQLRSARSGGEWSLTHRRVVFLDFSRAPMYRSRKSRTSDSQENPTERDVLRSLLARLSRKNRGTIRHVLVICPYEAQRSAVQAHLHNTRLDFTAEATTVDAVQGGEADLVILLMTRSRGRVQFLLDRHRLNVALSRAREAVIILGHLQCLSPRGAGPVAELVRRGQHNDTLQLLQPRPRPQPWRTLAAEVVP